MRWIEFEDGVRAVLVTGGAAILALGFAGGAMIFLVVQELLPESFAHSSPTEAAWGVTIGLVGMLGFIAAIGL